MADIGGQFEFFVRKINQGQSLFTWEKVHDFDRLESFVGGKRKKEVNFKNELVFKLVNSSLELESQIGGSEVLDAKPQQLREGYDCFSIYKHSDNSYEWRACRIVGKELRYTENREMKYLQKKLIKEADRTSAKNSQLSAEARYDKSE